MSLGTPTTVIYGMKMFGSTGGEPELSALALFHRCSCMETTEQNLDIRQLSMTNHGETTGIHMETTTKLKHSEQLAHN